MPYENKAALKTAITERLNRTSFSDEQLNTFIRNAEVRANRLLRLQDSICIKSGAVTAGTEYFALPSNWAGLTENKWVAADGTVTDLTYVDHKAAADRAQEESSGVPTYYAIVGPNMRFIPPPAEAGTLTYFAYERFELLEDEDSNALLAEDPDIYFNFAVAEAMRHEKHDLAEIAEYERLAVTGCRELRISDMYNKSGGTRGEGAEFF